MFITFWKSWSGDVQKCSEEMKQAILVDLAKAFNSVSTQTLRVEGHLYNLQLIYKGVPQGSILGPNLFVIFFF